jgi:hypothetical protein
VGAMISLSAAQASQAVRAIPIWRSDAFVGEFADCFVAGTDLEGGNIGTSLKLFLPIAREVVRKGPSDRLFLTVIPRLLSLLEQCAELADEMQAIRLLPAATQADKFIAFLAKFQALLKNLKAGTSLVFPVFWVTSSISAHVLLCVVEAGSTDSSWTFTIVNTGDGVLHRERLMPLCRYWLTPYVRVVADPGQPEGFPKIKRRTALRLTGVAKERLVDEATLFALLRPAFVASSEHCSAMYNIVFTHIAGGSIPRAADKVNSDRCCLEATTVMSFLFADGRV